MDDFVLRRLFLTLMLYQIMKEVSIWQVAHNFNQSRGFLQSLLTSASSFGALLVHFTEVRIFILFIFLSSLTG